MTVNSHSLQDNEFYQKGLAALRKKNYGYAVELFQEVLKDNPDFTECQHNLWSAARAKRKTTPQSFIQLSLEVIKKAFLNIKLIQLTMLNKTTEAITTAKQIVLLNPDNIPALHKLATLFIEQKKTNNALVALEEIMLINRKNVESLRLLARLYFENKDFQKAKATARILLESSPNDLAGENILKDIAALGAIENGFDEIKPAT